MQSLYSPGHRKFLLLMEFSIRRGVESTLACTRRKTDRKRERERDRQSEKEGRVGSQEMVANLFSGAYTFNPFVWSWYTAERNKEVVRSWARSGLWSCFTLSPSSLPPFTALLLLSPSPSPPLLGQTVPAFASIELQPEINYYYQS